MDIVMLQTIPDESINGGRTTQTFVKTMRYPVPDEIGQIWIGRGWAKAMDGSSGLSGFSGVQTKQTKETNATKQTKE